MALLNPARSREIVHLAIPVVISQISQTVVGLVDTMMVGRISVHALAATGMSGIAVWMVIGALSHISTGTQILTSRRVGERRPREAGRVLAAALRLALLCGPLLTLLILRVFPLYYELILDGRTDPLYPICRDYTAWRITSLLPFLVISVLRGFFNGLGDTKQHMRVSLLVNALNVVLNWVFIFGRLGAPAMGAPGAGFASMLATTCGCAYFVLRAAREDLGRRFGFRLRGLLFPRDARRAGASRAAERPYGCTRSLLRLSTPTGIQTFFVLAGFTLFMAMMNHVGTTEVAASNVIITIMSFSFMPGFGIGVAASTLIGQRLGAGMSHEAELLGREAQKIGMLLMSAIGLFFILLPDQLLGLFTDNAEVIAAGRLPLQLMGLIQAFDALCMVTAACLEGAGMTLFVMWSELFVNWAYFIPFTWLAVFVLDSGILLPFVGLAFYVLLYSGILQWKFRRGDWKTRKV